MDRQPPRSTSNAIDLYIRTYYSLLRSSGEVRVRAFEEAHAFSDSSLHTGARDERPDVAAFGYSAARLPGCLTLVRHLVAGQSLEQFERAGLQVHDWPAVSTRGRRRPHRWDGGQTLAVFVTSASDIDDLVPILTAYQIEWNKMHMRLANSDLGTQLVEGTAPSDDAELRTALEGALGLSAADVGSLCSALGEPVREGLAAIAASPRDLRLRLLAGTLLEYRRATQRWWEGIERSYLAKGTAPRPVYFVSSNTHALCNLIGGYAREHRESIFEFAREHDEEGLAERIDAAQRDGDEHELSNLSYYLLRRYLTADPETTPARMEQVQRFDAQCGISTLSSPGHLDVNVQLMALRDIQPERLDPRARVDDLAALQHSDAVIINIDYPLGMAAYHHLTQLAHGVGELRGVYVVGKAATLNGRVGDIMLSTVAYDEHSSNSYLFRNCFVAADLDPHVRFGTVLDNQKALTVRGSFLQNRDYMDVFYSEGYTVVEMEAGPYLSAIYEMVHPKRHPTDEVVHLSNLLPFDFGLLHYASDTPYSRRQSLLSKSLSYFGMDATYGCAIATLRRILSQEIAHVRGGSGR
ncbi:MAG: hypothetical protein K0V04_03815 [Deltaproteobacteria bacterium]|nr:hypothetical protein [Deltaproteobacteria bacterium]